VKFIFLAVFSVFLIAMPAHARVLRGDWQSAGDLPQPWYPAYNYQYNCHLELTDGDDRKGDGLEIPAGQRYRLYAVQKFTIDQASRGFSEGRSWTWVATNEDSQSLKDRERILKSAPKGAFSPEGNSVSMSFEAGGDDEDFDQVTLSAHVKLPFGAHYVSQHGSETRPRKAKAIKVKVTAAVYPQNGSSSSQRRMAYVVCDKVK